MIGIILLIVLFGGWLILFFLERIYNNTYKASDPADILIPLSFELEENKNSIVVMTEDDNGELQERPVKRIWVSKTKLHIEF